MTKKCTSCKKPLPLDQFHKCSHARDGLQYKCKECSYQTVKLSRDKHFKNKEKAVERWRELYGGFDF